MPPEVDRAVDDAVSASVTLRTMLGSLLDPSSLGPVWAEPEGKQAKRQGAGRRYQIQTSRRRGDGEVLPLAHAAVRRWADAEPSAAPLADVLARWGAPERAGSRRRIAVVTSDTLAKRMAGPGIRATEIARRLAVEHDVVLATTGICDISVPGLEVRQVGELGPPRARDVV